MNRRKTHDNSCGVLHDFDVEVHRRHLYPPVLTLRTCAQGVVGVVVVLGAVTVPPVSSIE